MIRKILHISVVFLLVFTTAGITVSKHYCGGKLEKISITGEPKSCCGMGEGCCHNESETFQIKTDYTFDIQQLNFEDYHVLDMLSFETCFLNIETCNNSRFDLKYYDISPPPKSVHRFLAQIQTYLI